MIGPLKIGPAEVISGSMNTSGITKMGLKAIVKISNFHLSLSQNFPQKYMVTDDFYVVEVHSTAIG